MKLDRKQDIQPLHVVYLHGTETRIIKRILCTMFGNKNFNLRKQLNSMSHSVSLDETNTSDILYVNTCSPESVGETVLTRIHPNVGYKRSPTTTYYIQYKHVRIKKVCDYIEALMNFCKYYEEETICRI